MGLEAVLAGMHASMAGLEHADRLAKARAKIAAARPAFRVLFWARDEACSRYVVVPPEHVRAFLRECDRNGFSLHELVRGPVWGVADYDVNLENASEGKATRRLKALEGRARSAAALILDKCFKKKKKKDRRHIVVCRNMRRRKGGGYKIGVHVYFRGDFPFKSAGVLKQWVLWADRRQAAGDGPDKTIYNGDMAKLRCTAFPKVDDAHRVSVYPHPDKTIPVPEQAIYTLSTPLARASSYVSRTPDD